MPTNTLTKAGVDCAPPLTAKLAPWMERLLGDPAQIRNYLQLQGSPLHVTVASEFERNVTDLLSPLKARNVAGSLYFARKANKLQWFVSAAKDANIGVDTASLQELRETLALGVDPQKVIVTAVGKEDDLVSEAVAGGCLLVIDNLDELEIVRSAAWSLAKVARIGLRLSGFQVAERKIYSRFGFPIEEARQLIEQVNGDDFLSLDILHAHLDRYDPAERACAASQLIELVDYAATLPNSQKIRGIDLGGGILMRYLDNQDQWTVFLDRLRESVSGQCPSFTFMDDGLGYIKAGNEVYGKPDLYPAWNDISKERFIASILDFVSGTRPLHKELSSRGLNLYFEPGRALLDNTGMTFARITFRKRDTAGNLLLGAAINRTNLRPFRAEFCSDPILLADGERQTQSEGAFLVGNLCSESDLLFRRRLALTHLPEPGDIVCFANTAGYLAHHMEIGTHGNPLPKNVLIDPDDWSILSTQ